MIATRRGRPRWVMSSADQGAQEESDVRRPFRQPARQVWVPGRAERNVGADPVSHARKFLLEIGPDAVKHLYFEPSVSNAAQLGGSQPMLNELSIVSRQGRIVTLFEQPIRQEGELRLDLLLLVKSHGLRFGIRALDQSDARPDARHLLEINRRAPEVCLHSQAEFWEVGLQQPVDVEGVGDIVRLLHVYFHRRPRRIGLCGKPPQVVDTGSLVEGQPELGELYGDR